MGQALPRALATGQADHGLGRDAGCLGRLQLVRDQRRRRVAPPARGSVQPSRFHDVRGRERTGSSIRHFSLGRPAPSCPSAFSSQSPRGSGVRRTLRRDLVRSDAARRHPKRRVAPRSTPPCNASSGTSKALRDVSLRGRRACAPRRRLCCRRATTSAAARHGRPRGCRARSSFSAAPSTSQKTIAESLGSSPSPARKRFARATSWSLIASTPICLDHGERRRGRDPHEPGRRRVEPPGARPRVGGAGRRTSGADPRPRTTLPPRGVDVRRGDRDGSP